MNKIFTIQAIQDTLEKFKHLAQEKGLIVYAVALKGSQNYNLDDEDSDIDANLVFIPTLKQIRTNETFKITLPEGECTCHNIYSFAEIVAKGNPQWVEVCNTEYIIGDLSIFKDYKVNPSALKGMMMEKVAAFDKLYPSREKYVKEFGYDPKQLHHIIRLYDVLQKDVKFYKYTDEEKQRMLDIKRGRFPGNVEDAFKLRDEYVQKVQEIYEQRKLEYQPQTVDFDVIDIIVFDELVKNRGGQNA
jgi:predicted nucleotidyltransferase